MSDSIEFELGEDSVRFTSDGMIFIEDAIKALIREYEENTETVWERMKKDHPGILNHCGSYVTKEGNLIQTADIEGLDKIFHLLPGYML